MDLVQLFLPLRAENGLPFPRADFDAVRDELAARFGGVTTYVRSPAVGLWEDEDGACVRDELILFEVMVDGLERDWWRAFRARMERRFSQEEILLRASPVEKL